MTNQPQGARIVTMQQITMLLSGTGLFPVGAEDAMHWNADNKARAERDLSAAIADGYEIVNVTVSVGERVIATVWTLQPSAQPVNITTYGKKQAYQREQRNHDAE